MYKHRLYPYNELAAQLIGFTNNNNHGKYGIEGYFDKILNGTERLVEFNKNARGKIVSAKDNYKISNGSDIYLTIDINIQDILQSELKKPTYHIVQKVLMELLLTQILVKLLQWQVFQILI